VTCKVFNVGNYRRTSLGNFQAVPRLEDHTTFPKRRSRRLSFFFSFFWRHTLREVAPLPPPPPPALGCRACHHTTRCVRATTTPHNNNNNNRTNRPRVGGSRPTSLTTRTQRRSRSGRRARRPRSTTCARGSQRSAFRRRSSIVRLGGALISALWMVTWGLSHPRCPRGEDGVWR
jgi:hypothetical protein